MAIGAEARPVPEKQKQTPMRQEQKPLRKTKVWGAVGLGVALLTPSLAMNIVPQGPAGLVGRAVPLVFVVAFVAVLCIAFCFARLSRRYQHSGSVYALVGATLGPRSGFVACWSLLGAYTAFTAGTLVVAGIFCSSFLDATGIWHGASWVPVSIVALLGAIALGLYPLRRATRTLLIIEGLTVLLITLIIVVVFVNLFAHTAPGGKGFSFSVFSPPSGIGGSSFFLAIVFGFLAFGGFEASATLGEETVEPQRAVPRAIMGTVLFAGVFYIFVTVGETLGFGINAQGTKAFIASSSIVGSLGHTYVASWVGDTVTLGAAFSAFGGAVACAVGGSRLLFALGRDGFGPRQFGTLSGRGLPTIALLAVITAAVITIVVLRAAFTNVPFNIYAWAGSTGTILLLVPYLGVTLAAARFMIRERDHRWHLVVPLLGAVIVVYTLYRTIFPIPSGPGQYYTYVASAWLLVAIAAVFLRAGLAERIGQRLSEAVVTTGESTLETS